jgi:DNA-binding transcriptional ArsR family regulator
MSPRSAESARYRRVAPIFFALGDETRLAIVTKLSEGEPRSIAQLTNGMKRTRQAVTKHLRVLEHAKLVRHVRHGREVLFELDPEPFKDVRAYAELVSAHWDRALARLKAFVED